MVTGLVLAAGGSSRMGHPKALTPVGGEAAIERACRVLEEGGCEGLVVVLGADAERIRERVPESAKVVVHGAWSRGRSGSLKAGLGKISSKSDVLVLPVDHPLVEDATVKRLLASPGDIRIPTFKGKRGHPTFFGAAVRKELAALGDDQPLHDVVHAHPERVVEVPVTDAGVLANLDHPEDVGAASRARGGGPPARPPS